MQALFSAQFARLGIPAAYYADRLRDTLSVLGPDVQAALFVADDVIAALSELGFRVETFNLTTINTVNVVHTVSPSVYVRELVVSDQEALLDAYCTAYPSDAEHVQTMRHRRLLYIGCTLQSSATRRLVDDIREPACTRFVKYVRCARELPAAVKQIRIVAIPVVAPVGYDVEWATTVARWPFLINSQLGGYHHTLQFGSERHLALYSLHSFKTNQINLITQWTNAGTGLNVQKHFQWRHPVRSFRYKTFIRCTVSKLFESSITNLTTHNEDRCRHLFRLQHVQKHFLWRHPVRSFRYKTFSFRNE
jgi:hypothetical protein